MSGRGGVKTVSILILAVLLSSVGMVPESPAQEEQAEEKIAQSRMISRRPPFRETEKESIRIETTGKSM